MSEKLFLSWHEIFERIEIIGEDIKGKKVYGVPKGGMIIAGMMATKGHKITYNLSDAEVIVDDLVDSGNTRNYYKTTCPDTPFMVLCNKQTENALKGKWVVFPWETEHPGEEEDSVQENVVRILEYIGENPGREGLQDTPKRVVKMWDEMFRGYSEKKMPKITKFLNGADGLVYDQMIIDNGDFYSHCEHHMVPFFGQYWFGYVPDPAGYLIGLSKVARIVDYHAARLQVQERLVHDIVEHLWSELTEGGVPRPLGMGLVMRGEHLCKTMRGVKKKGAMTTTKLKGAFFDNPAVRNEFLSAINNG